MTPEQISYLDYTLWRTSTTRFIASARTAVIHRCIQISLISCNAYLIGFSSLAFAGRIDSRYVNLSNFFAIVVSVFILAFGAYIQIADLSAKSKVFYESGRVARKLLQRLKGNCSQLSYESIISEYQAAVDPIPNHTDIDNSVFIIRNFGSLRRQKKASFVDFGVAALKYAAFYMLPLILAYLLTVVSPLALFFRIGNWS